MSKNTFNAKKITKYYKNQNPETSLDKQFIDPLFLPDENSLLARNSDGSWIGDDSKATAIDAKTIVWRNSHEIFGEAYNLFDDKIECSDIKQGNLGNCYFLCSLAALCEFPELIFQIFRTNEKSEFGYYEICLFIEGEWQIVIVDDYFPVSATDKKTFKFARPNGNELWAVLLEKAWAKVNGGYRNTISGKENEALNALTGFPAERFDITHMSIDELWELIKKSDISSNVMATTTINDPSIKDKVGLISLHAYTLIGCATIKVNGNDIKLVKIRNPWGHTEWKGKWGDNSDAWTDDAKKQVNLKEGNDGEFWMSLEDYHKHYSSLAVCSIMPNSNVKIFKFPVNVNNYAPKAYNIYLKNDTTFALGAIDRHFRYTRELLKESSPTFILLAKYENHKLEYIDGDFSVNTSVDLIKDLKAGKYVFWVWNDAEHSKNIFEDDGETKYIKVIFTGNEKYYVKEQADDTHFSLLKRILYEGVVKDSDPKSQQIFTQCKNMFAKTGFGYRLVQNNTSQWRNVWQCDPTSIQAMNLLAPYNNKEFFTFEIGPNDWDFIIAARSGTVGKYWFNIKSSNNSVKDTVNEIKHNNDDYYNSFCDDTIENMEVDDKFYDYCSSNLDNDQPDFKKEDLNEIKLDESRKKYPEYCALLDLVPESNEENLKYDLITSAGNTYIGQLNENIQRHGRGVFIFKEGTGYAGEWKNNKKQGFGISFGAKINKIYEGQFVDNKMHGKGTYYYTNGDIVESEYVNGVREGPGTYFWKFGASWEGAFKNNLMHGTGKYKMDGNEFTITYENGKQKR